jgi:hypothetical protein
MRNITGLMLRISRVWWAFLLVFVLNGLSFTILFGLEDQFEALTGQPVFDTQNDLTTDAVVKQLPLYQGEARDAYWRFWAFDFVFPLVAALFLAVVWAFALRNISWRINERLLRWNVPALAFVATLFDWLENVANFAVLTVGSDPLFLNAVILFKRLKLVTLTISGAITMVLLVLLIVNVVYRIFRARQQLNASAPQSGHEPRPV